MATKKTSSRKATTTASKPVAKPQARSIAAKRTTTKTASVKTPVRTQTPKASVKSEPTEAKKVTPSKMPLRNVIIALIVILILAIIFVFKNQFIVATVNGQPVTRLELVRELEKKDGKTVLTSLVTEKLIMQEAEKKKITVTDDDVKKEIGNIEKNVTAQGQNIDLLLAQQGMTRSDLNKQVKLQLMLKKMVGTVAVSQKEVDDYVNQNKDSIPEGTDPATISAQAKQQLEQQKTNDKIQSLITDLQKKAKIDYLLKI